MSFGPIIMSVKGDVFTEGARILAVVWNGTTTSGDTVELRCPKTNRLLWDAMTSDTKTYLGINLGNEGAPAPFGFKLTQISAGKILVYLRENT